MQPLHPIDAISPAFERTHQTLLTPFKAGRAWKLAACSYLAFAGSVFIPFPLALLMLPAGVPHAPFVLLLAVLVPFLLYLALFYVGNRMVFVEFEMLVTRAKFVAPMWNRYGSRTLPYMGLKMLWGTLVSIAFAPMLLVRIREIAVNFAGATPRLTPGQGPDPALFAGYFNQLLGLEALLFVIYLVIKIFDMLLNDFVLPFYAIEEISLGTAIASGWDVMRRDPWNVLLYFVLKFLLAVMGYICLGIATLLCEVPLLIAAFLLGGLGFMVTRLVPGAAGHLVTVVGGVLLEGALFLTLLAAVIACSGYLFSLLEAYAIYFLGGRYQKLGDYLQPPSYTYAPPPLPPSPEEEDDDDGPPLPMDPALV